MSRRGKGRKPAAPWWADDLARAGEELPQDVQLVQLRAQGRDLEIAYRVDPPQRVLTWATKGAREASGLLIGPQQDPIQAIQAAQRGELEPSRCPSGESHRGWPWWGRLLCGLSDDLPRGVREETIGGELVAWKVGQVRRVLTWTVRGGAVAEDGVWYSGLTQGIGPRVDPAKVIQRELDTVKSKDGEPVQPWESDVDGLAPGRIPTGRRPRRRGSRP